jgi:hypothetical protein
MSLSQVLDKPNKKLSDHIALLHMIWCGPHYSLSVLVKDLANQWVTNREGDMRHLTL